MAAVAVADCGRSGFDQARSAHTVLVQGLSAVRRYRVSPGIRLATGRGDTVVRRGRLRVSCCRRGFDLLDSVSTRATANRSPKVTAAPGSKWPNPDFLLD